MIQRIQTIFLSVALLFTGLLIWFPLGEVAINEKVFTFSISGILDTVSGKIIYPSWYLIVFTGILLLFQLIIIIGYKNRKQQIQFIIINILLLVVLLIGSWLFESFSAKTLGHGVYSLKLPMAFPIVSIFFNYLAISAIRRDEALVKSIDRIR